MTRRNGKSSIGPKSILSVKLLPLTWLNKEHFEIMSEISVPKSAIPNNYTSVGEYGENRVELLRAM